MIRPLPTCTRCHSPHHVRAYWICLVHADGWEEGTHRGDADVLLCEGCAEEFAGMMEGIAKRMTNER